MVVNKDDYQKAGIFCLAKREQGYIRYQYLLTKDGVIEICKEALPQQWIDGNYFFEEFYLEKGSKYKLQVIAHKVGGVSKLHKKLVYEQSFTVDELINYTAVGKMFPCEYQYTE